jgi:hypothetical protein
MTDEKIRNHNKRKQLKDIENFILDNIEFEIEGHIMTINDDKEDSRHKTIVIDVYGHKTPLSSKMNDIFSRPIL